MGFPSPAEAFVERTLSINTICQLGANSLAIETRTGYAVIERAMKPKQNDLVLIDFGGRSQFARLMGHSLITDDGEALEGEALDDVNVAGVVTFVINRTSMTSDDELPVI